MKQEIDFEVFLMEKHAGQFIGPKDLLVDNFDDWITELEVDEMIEYGNEYAKKVLKEQNKK